MDPAALPPRSRRILIAAAVAIVTVFVFLPALQGQFLNWDDGDNFLRNLNYRGLGPAQLKWMFSDYYGHYMPLTWLTLGLDYVLWGMNPVGYHATSILFHAANAVLFFLFLHGLLRRSRPGGDDPELIWAAAVGALFFSLHPLRVESVAWITERRDVTSGFFFFLTLLAYLRMTDEAPQTGPYRKWLLLSVAAFAGSCLSKAMGMTLPLVLALLDAWPLKRYGPGKTAAVLREKIPFILLLVAAIVLTAIGQRHANTFLSYEDYPLWQMLSQPGYRISFYVLKTLLPFGLSPIYFYRPQIGLPQVLGWAAVIGISALVLIRRRQMPAAAVAWISYGLLIAPVSGLVQAGPHFAADRYSYLACLPFAALLSVAWLIPRPEQRGISRVLAGGLLIALSILSALQCRVWSNSITLWNHAIALEPDVSYLLQNRGSARADQLDWTGAIADFDRSIALNPNYPKSWYGRGLARGHLGNFAGAAEDFTRALEIEPKEATTLSARGVARANLGDRAGALEDCDEAVRLEPDLNQTRYHRGMVRFAFGDMTGAIADYTLALRLTPDMPEAYFNRGLAYARLGKSTEAIADFTRALELKPAYPEAHASRGAALLDLGDRPAATRDLQKALALAPENWPRRRQTEELLFRAVTK